jgi:hypothetical protein
MCFVAVSAAIGAIGVAIADRYAAAVVEEGGQL